MLHLDARNTNSYSGSGNTWSDLSGNNYNATISGATFNSNGKYFYFDGSSHITIPIEEGFDTSFIESEEHQFSVYDLDGSYAFCGGFSEMNMSYDDIAECINEKVFSNTRRSRRTS